MTTGSKETQKQGPKNRTNSKRHTKGNRKQGTYSKRTPRTKPQGKPKPTKRRWNGCHRQSGQKPDPTPRPETRRHGPKPPPNRARPTGEKKTGGQEERRERKEETHEEPIQDRAHEGQPPPTKQEPPTGPKGWSIRTGEATKRTEGAKETEGAPRAKTARPSRRERAWNRENHTPVATARRNTASRNDGTGDGGEERRKTNTHGRDQEGAGRRQNTRWGKNPRQSNPHRRGAATTPQPKRRGGLRGRRTGHHAQREGQQN